MRVPLRERSFGELIGLCFAVSAGNFGRLFLLALLMNLPTAFLAVFQEDAARDHNTLALAMAGVTWLVFVLTSPMLQAATIRLVASSFTGESPSLADCVRLALRKMWPVLGYGMVTGLITSIGIVLCVVPGLMFMTWYYLGAPVVVVENATVTDAMARSKKLSEGLRWELFAFILVTNLLFQAIILGVKGGLEAVLDPRIAPWVDLPISSLLSMPITVAPIVYYFSVRVAKEGFDLDRLSALIQGIGEGVPRSAQT